MLFHEGVPCSDWFAKYAAVDSSIQSNTTRIPTIYLEVLHGQKDKAQILRPGDIEVLGSLKKYQNVHIYRGVNR